MSLSESRVRQLALEYLEEQRREIQAQINELRRRMGDQGIWRRGRPPKSENRVAATPTKSGRKGLRQMTAEQKKVISERMKQSWALRRAAKK